MKFSLNTQDLDLLINHFTLTKDKLPEIEENIRSMIALSIKINAEVNFNGAPYNDIVNSGFETVNIDVHVQNEKNYSVVFTNQLEAVFIEFGAGVHYNGPPGSSPHPSGAKNAFYIGSYGYGYGKYDVWTFRQDGHTYATHGTPASMPLWHAVQDVIPEIPDIARFVMKEALTT